MTISRGMISVLAAVVITAVATLWLSSSCSPRPRYVVTDTLRVTPPELMQQIQDLQLERNGLRARLAGVEARPPKTITVTDTLIQACPAFFSTGFRVQRGELAVGRFDQAQEDSVSGWRPSLPAGLDVSDCDDGWSYGASGLLCNRPRFGHLEVFGAGVAVLDTLGLVAPDFRGEAGFSWTPSFRSLWQVDVYGTTGRTLEARIRRALIRLW